MSVVTFEGGLVTCNGRTLLLGPEGTDCLPWCLPDVPQTCALENFPNLPPVITVQISDVLVGEIGGLCMSRSQDCDRAISNHIFEWQYSVDDSPLGGWQYSPFIRPGPVPGCSVLGPGVVSIGFADGGLYCGPNLNLPGNPLSWNATFNLQVWLGSNVRFFFSWLFTRPISSSPVGTYTFSTFASSTGRTGIVCDATRIPMVEVQ